MTPTAMLSVQVIAEWDDEASVWVATSADVPGLVTEHADFSELQRRVMDLIPILLAENGLLPQGAAEERMRDIPVHIAAQAVATMRASVPVH